MVTASNVNINFTVANKIKTGKLQSVSVVYGGPSLRFDGGYIDRPAPTRCKSRRGGPRSHIFCEQFEIGFHSMHVGRSRTGRWYQWENEDDNV